MSFTGLSSDEHGSIIYDGEKFIVTVPVGHEQLEHFNPDGSIPVVYTHPSHAQNQQTSTEQSTGQTSSSDSGGQGGSGASQTEDSRDNNQAKDDISVHAVLPDIAEVQDDFGTPRWVDNTSWDRLHRYSNLDFILVQQDIERRPHTFKRCFEQAESPRSALEFIYAEPPDLDDNTMIHLQDYLSQESNTMSGWWGKTSDGEDSGTLNVDTGLLSTVHKIEEHLESEYGYQIEWGEGISNAEKLKQLHELAEASDHIVDYLDLVFIDDPNTTGKEAFREHFSGSQDDSPLVVNLGADAYFAEKFSNISKEEAGYYGQVPASGENRVYLGSKVDIPIIVHEFGHVIDWSKGFTSYLTESVETDSGEWKSRIARDSEKLGEQYIAKYSEEYGHLTAGYFAFNLDTMVMREIIEGFVAKQYFVQELWADLLATAVLDPGISGETFEVKSIDDDKIFRPIPKEGEEAVAAFPETKYFSDFDSPYPSSDRHFYKCGDEGISCVSKPVMWEDTRRARVAQELILRVFRELLSTEGEDK